MSKGGLYTHTILTKIPRKLHAKRNFFECTESFILYVLYKYSELRVHVNY